MIKQAFMASVLLAGTSAFAQTTTPTSDQSPPVGTAQPSTTTEPTVPTTGTTATQPAPTTGTTPSGTQPAQPADPADSATSTPATPATPASPAQTQTVGDQASGDTVVATVEADWAKYDTNSGGTLSRTEFNKWVTDLQTAANSKAPTSSYLRSAFRKADANKNGSISKEELQTFLRG
jgi:cytoskeletal protein RodZ